MAIAQGSIILSSDMQSWYTRLNTIISKFGGSMSTMTVPANNKIAQASDVNTVVNKLAAMKADPYLGADSTLYNTGYQSVSVGDYIKVGQGTALNQVITNLETIKCRNDATYKQGCVETSYSGNTKTGYSGWSQSYYSGDSQSYYSGDSQSYYSANSQSAYTANSQGYCSFGRKQDGGRQNGDQCGYWGKSSYTAWSQSSYGGWSQSSYGGWSQYSYGAWSQSSYSGWTESSYSGWTQSTCSKGTVIDIKNARTFTEGE